MSLNEFLCYVVYTPIVSIALAGIARSMGPSQHGFTPVSFLSLSPPIWLNLYIYLKKCILLKLTV